MAGAGYYVFNQALQGGAYVKVPDLTLRPITEASLLLAQQGLEIGKQTQAPDERVPKFYVIHQRPAAGRVVRTGRKVYLTVSTGTESQHPPNLIGKTLQEADEELRRTSFTLGTVARMIHDSPRDTVIGQDPTAAQLAANAAHVNLLVSEGKGQRDAFIMPDIYRKPVQEMLQLLAPFGVKPVPNIVDMPDQPTDVVLDQQPPPGSLIQPGDRVIYNVRPSGNINLPDAQRKVQVSYTVPNVQVEREVRVDAIDRNGSRVTVFPLERHYVDGEPPRFGAGYSIELPPLTFVDKMTVEIYLDGQLAQSNYYEGNAEPVVKRYNVE